MIACALFKGQTSCHLRYLYYAFEKDKQGWGGRVGSFKWGPRDKRGLSKRKVRLQRINPYRTNVESRVSL